MAEVLITLGIIGVVAAMTIPTLIADYNQRSWDTGSSVFNRKLGEALKVMNANSTLAGYNSTEDFVKELGKNIKILRTCDSNHLTDCFTETINTGADPIDTTKLKKSKNLYSSEDYGTDTIGVQFADGVSALIAYNPNVKQDPYNNSNDANSPVSVTGNGKSVSLNTKALSILYDVSGSKNPNSFGTNKDIRGININIKTGASILVIGSSYTAVDCSTEASSSTDLVLKADYDAYCGTKPSGYSEDYWAGANKACAEQGMKLPAIGSYNSSNLSCKADSAEDTLCSIFINHDEYGITTSYLTWYWSSTENSDIGAFIGYNSSNYGLNAYYKSSSGGQVLCIGN